MSIDDYINEHFDEITEGMDPSKVDDYLNTIRKFYLNHHLEIADENVQEDSHPEQPFMIKIPKECIEEVCIDVIEEIVEPAQLSLAGSIETLAKLVESQGYQIISLQQTVAMQSKLIDILLKDDKKTK